MAPYAVVIFGMDKRLELERLAVAPGMAEETVSGRVGRQQETVRCHDEDEVRGVLHEGHLAARGVEHGPLGGNAGRDVDDDPRSPIRLARFATQRDGPKLQVVLGESDGRELEPFPAEQAPPELEELRVGLEDAEQAVPEQ